MKRKIAYMIGFLVVLVTFCWSVCYSIEMCFDIAEFGWYTKSMQVK